MLKGSSEGFGSRWCAFLMGFEDIIIVEKDMPSLGVLSVLGEKVLA